jgi:serine/threonine protein phosphatase PrpC/phosphotransferase system HPr-like phosphotransfer protein
MCIRTAGRSFGLSQRTAFKIICRSIALLLTACLLIQDAALALPDGGAVPASGKPLSPYAIPPSVAWTGPLQSSARTSGSGDDLAVVLIEDAHTNPSGQMNLASALEAVVRRHHMSVVFTEGSDRDVSLSEFRRLGTSEQRARLAAPFVRRGELKGSEFLQITGEGDFAIMGVEDRALYERSVDLYARAAASRAKLKTTLDRAEVSMRAVAERLLNPRLSTFIALRDAHESEKVSSADYFSRLTVLADEAGVAPASMSQLARLDRVRRMERAVDYEKAGLEWAAAVRSLPEGERDALSGTEVGAARRDRLEAAAAAGARLRRAMGPGPVRGALGRYLRYLEAIERLDPHVLLKQAGEIEARVEAALAVTPDEARLVRMRRALASLRELADLSATPEAVARIEAAGRDGELQRIAAFLNRQILELGIAPERAILYEKARAEEIRSAQDFYRTAFERDRLILDRLTAAARERGLKEAVLITGGFHTPHLASLIRERGMSVRVITPQVYEPTDRGRYEKLLLAQVSRDGGSRTGSGRSDADPASALITPYAAETPSVLAALRRELGSLDAGGARFADTRAVMPSSVVLPADLIWEAIRAKHGTAYKIRAARGVRQTYGWPIPLNAEDGFYKRTLWTFTYQVLRPLFFTAIFSPYANWYVGPNGNRPFALIATIGGFFYAKYLQDRDLAEFTGSTVEALGGDDAFREIVRVTISDLIEKADREPGSSLANDVARQGLRRVRQRLLFGQIRPKAFEFTMGFDVKVYFDEPHMGRMLAHSVDPRTRYIHKLDGWTPLTTKRQDRVQGAAEGSGPAVRPLPELGRAVPAGTSGARMAHRYVRATAEEAGTLYQEWVQNMDLRQEEYVGVFGSGLLRARVPRPLMFITDGGAVEAKLKRMRSLQMSESVFAERLVKDEAGIFWLLKEYKTGDARWERPFQNVPRRERFAYLLSRGKANLTPVRLLTEEEMAGIKPGGSAELHYLTRVVTASNLPASELPHAHPVQAFASILVANVLMRKMDPQMFNVGYSGPIPVAIDHDETFGPEYVSTPIGLGRFAHDYLFHALLMMAEYWLHPNIRSVYDTDFLHLYSNIHEHAPDRRMQLKFTGLLKLVEKFGLGEGLVAAEKLDPELIERSILAFKRLDHEGILAMAREAGYQDEEAVRVAALVEKNRLSLGGDIGYLWDSLHWTPKNPGRFRALDQPRAGDSGEAGARMPERRSHQFDGPLVSRREFAISAALGGAALLAAAVHIWRNGWPLSRGAGLPPARPAVPMAREVDVLASERVYTFDHLGHTAMPGASDPGVHGERVFRVRSDRFRPTGIVWKFDPPVHLTNGVIRLRYGHSGRPLKARIQFKRSGETTAVFQRETSFYPTALDGYTDLRLEIGTADLSGIREAVIVLDTLGAGAGDALDFRVMRFKVEPPPAGGARMSVGPERVVTLPIPRWVPLLREGVAEQAYRRLSGIGEAMGMDEVFFERMVRRIMEEGPLGLAIERSRYRVREKNGDGHHVHAVDKVKTYPKLIHWQERWERYWTAAAHSAPDAAEKLRRLSMAEFLGEIGSGDTGHERGVTMEAFVEGRREAYRSALGVSGRSRVPAVEALSIPMEGGDPIPARLVRPAVEGAVPVVIVYHGFGMSGSSAYFDELEEKLLLEQGFAVLRPDLLSHGQSHRAMGSKAVMKQYNNAIAAFIRSRGQDLDAARVGIYGFSFGAYLALRAALQSDLRSMVKSLVLMNPPTDETFTRSRIFQWHEGLLRELFPVEDFQRLVDKTQTLKLPLTEFLNSLSDEERRVMAEGALVFLSTNDETIHFKDQAVIRGFAAGIGAPVVPLVGQGHFPVGPSLHGAYGTAARHLGRTLAGGARMAVAAGDWRLTVATTQSAEINGELFGAAYDVTRAQLSELEAQIKDKLAGFSDLEAFDLTGRAELSYLSEGMWKWAFLLRLHLRDGREVPVVIKRGKFHDSFSHDEAAVIRAAQGNGAPVLILELPSSNGHFQFIEEYIDGPTADDLWASGSPDPDVRRQLVRSAIAVTRALGGEVPRDYLNRHNYIVERTGERALLVDLGNRRMKVLGEGADPWEQLFFIAGLADRFADNDPALIGSVVLRVLSEALGAGESRLWVSRVYAHLLILENDHAIIEKIAAVARPEEFKSEGEMLRAWDMDPELAGRLKNALGNFLASDSATTAAGAAGIEGLLDHLRRSRESGIEAHAAVLGMDDWIIRRASDDFYDDVWNKAAEHLKAGGRVIWYSNFGKEMWFERFYPSWKERLIRDGLWDSRGLQNSFLLSAGREFLVDDPHSGGFKVFLNQKAEDLADPISWATDRLSDTEGIKVGQGILSLSPFLGSAQELGRDLEVMRAFSAMVLAGRRVPERTGGLPAGRGTPIEIDDESSAAGFVWSARHLPGERLWDPDTLHLTPFIQTPGSAQAVEVPRGAEVYAVYQVPANGASDGLVKGGWVISEREMSSSFGARMADPVPPARASDPELRISGPMISLNVRDLGAVPMVSADGGPDAEPYVGVDMIKGLRTARSWLPEFGRQGIGRVYLVGLAASGEMSGLIQSDWREPRNRRPDSLGTGGPLFYYGNPGNNGVAVQVSAWLKNRKSVDGHRFDNRLGQNVFSVMDPRRIHEGSVPPAPTAEESQRVFEEELRALLREARELGIDVYGDWIPWRAPESVTFENYKRFFWRELTPEEEADYAKAVAEEKKLFPEGHGKRFEDTRSRRKLLPTERWIGEILKKAGPFVPVRLPLPDGGEKLVFVRRANIGIDSEDQLVPNPLHPDNIRESIEGLVWLSELGFSGVRTDLGFRLLLDYIRPYFDEMRAHLAKRGQTLEGWMRESGIRTLREGEPFEDWWERQKSTVQPLREIISVVRHWALEMDFVIEAYPYQSHEQKELLALGVDHNYDDSFFKGMLHALRTHSEALPEALRGALARAPHGTVYASNFDEDSLARLLKKSNRQSAAAGIRLLLAVLPRMGVPVLYTEREYLGLEGSAVPMPGGSDPNDDSHHPFPSEGEFADRLKPDWAARKIQSAPLPAMLRELEKALGPRTLPSEVWIPGNTNAKNRLVPLFWRDASGDWYLAIADLYPEWGANTGFGPGRIKIEINPSEMPAGLDPSLFTGLMAVHQPYAVWSQSPFWRIGTGDWLSKGSARTLDIDIDHDHYQSFNMVLKLGPGRTVSRLDPARPADIWEPGRQPRARERALLKLLAAAPAGDPEAVNAVQIALSYPDDNLRAQAANILARRSLVARSPHTEPADLAELMMDPFAPYRAAGVQIPQAYLRVYPEPVARQWLTRNGRYSLMHTLKHLSLLARGVNEEQAPGDAAYASAALKAFREKLAAAAADWKPSRDEDLRREVDRAIEETRSVRPRVEWDRDLGAGSSVPANAAEVLRTMVLRSEAVTGKYPKEHRDTFYWVLEAVREIVPDIAGDPAAEMIYRGRGTASGARMAAAAGAFSMGLRTDINEDSHLVKGLGNGWTLLAVFDGVGGERMAAEASARARDAVEAYFSSGLSSKERALLTPLTGAGDSRPHAAIESMMRNALITAQAAVRSIRLTEGSSGTTATLALSASGPEKESKKSSPAWVMTLGDSYASIWDPAEPSRLVPVPGFHQSSDETPAGRDREARVRRFLSEADGPTIIAIEQFIDFLEDHYGLTDGITMDDQGLISDFYENVFGDLGSGLGDPGFTAEQAWAWAYRRLTGGLYSDEDLSLDFVKAEKVMIPPGGLLIAATDGLWDNLSGPQIAAMIEWHTEDHRHGREPRDPSRAGREITLLASSLAVSARETESLSRRKPDDTTLAVYGHQWPASRRTAQEWLALLRSAAGYYTAHHRGAMPDPRLLALSLMAPLAVPAYTRLRRALGRANVAPALERSMLRLLEDNAGEFSAADAGLLPNAGTAGRPADTGNPAEAADRPAVPAAVGSTDRPLPAEGPASLDSVLFPGPSARSDRVAAALRLIEPMAKTPDAWHWNVLAQAAGLLRDLPEIRDWEALKRAASTRLSLDGGTIDAARAVWHAKYRPEVSGARMAEFQQPERPRYWDALRALQRMQAVNESTDHFKNVFIGDPELIRQTESGLEEARGLVLEAVREAVLLARNDPFAGPGPIIEALAFRVWQRRLEGNYLRRYTRYLMDLAAAAGDPEASQRHNEEALGKARRSASMLGAAYHDAVRQKLELAPKLRAEYGSALEGAGVVGKRLVRNLGTGKRFIPQRWRLYTDASKDLMYAIQLVEEARAESGQGQADRLERLISMRNDLNRSAALSIASTEEAWRAMMHTGDGQQVALIVPQLARLIDRVGWDRPEVLGALRVLAAGQVAVGDPGSAVRSCSRAIQTRPDDYWSRLELIKALIAAGDTARAEKALGDLRRLIPSLGRAMTAPAQARMRELEAALEGSGGQRGEIGRMPTPDPKPSPRRTSPPAPSVLGPPVHMPTRPADAPKKSKARSSARSSAEVRAAYTKFQGIDYAQMRRLMEEMVTAFKAEGDYSHDRFLESEWKEWYFDQPMPDWMTRYVEACARHRQGARMADDSVLASRETVFDEKQGVMHGRPSQAISRIGIFIRESAGSRGMKLEVRLRTADDKLVDAGSILSLMESGIRGGDKLRVEVVGDADPALAESVAVEFARMVNDRDYMSEPSLDNMPGSYGDIFSSILAREPMDEDSKEHLQQLEISRVARFIRSLVDAHAVPHRAHVAIETEDGAVAVFRVWREGREVWYALKGGAGRMRISEADNAFIRELPGQTPRITEETDTNDDRVLNPSAAVQLDLALAEDLLKAAGDFMSSDAGRQPILANVEMDAEDLVRRVGWAADQSGAVPILDKLRALQVKVRESGFGRLLFPGDTDALPNAPTVRLAHPLNAVYASAASPGSLLWQYHQKEAEIIPLLSSAILAALLAAAPEEGMAEYLAALTPLYQRLTGSTEALTPALLEEALRDPQRLAPIKPLTLRGYLDAAVYLQELSKKASATAA